MSLRKGQRKGNNGNHGAKGRSGGKPKAITILKRQMIENGKEDAGYAYSLFVSIMRDEKCDLGLRKDCAREVLDRILGKAKQATELSGPSGGPIETKDVSEPTDDERIAELVAIFDAARARASEQASSSASPAQGISG